jgi:clan AA aspartic protease
MLPDYGPGNTERYNVGSIYVNAILRNPTHSERSWEGRFLVDTGVVECLVPRPHLESVGLVPRGERTYVLADGSEISLEFTVGELEIMGEIVGATLVFAEADTEPLLGVTALESAGIEVDPRNETLKKLPSIRLKGLGQRVVD